MIKKYLNMFIGIVNYFFIIYVMPLLKASVISHKVFFIFLSVIIILSFINKKTKSFLSLKSSNGGLALFFVSLLISLLATLPGAGKGYDSYYFIYVLRTIPERGLNLIWETDRPTYYFFTIFLRNIFSLNGNFIDPKISVAISGVFGCFLFICSTYVLAKNLFDKETASYSALISSSTFMLTQFSINFIGNIYGISIMYLYINSMINYYRTKKPINIFISTCLILIAVQTHFFSAFFIGGIIGVFMVFIVIRQKQMENIKQLLVVILHGLLIRSVVGHSKISQNSFNTLSTLVNSLDSSRVYVLVETFKGLNVGFASEYFWVIFMSLCGLWLIIKRNNNEKGDLFFVWSLSIVLTAFYSRMYSCRILLYYPFGITAGYLMKQINYKKLKLFLVFFLVLVPLVQYQFNDRYMMVRYFEETQTYSWDTYYAETEQIIWITQNYDIEEIVVVSDIPFLDISLGGKLGETHPHLTLGVHYRVLSEIGNNLYIGTLMNLIEKDFSGYGEMDKNPYFGYEDNSTDKQLYTKTIIIPDQIYNIKPKDLIYLEPLFTIPNTTQIIYTLKDEFK